MLAAPDAMLDDGLLEVIVLESVGKLAFLTKILPKVFKGTHVEQPSVHVFRAREVAISADRPFTMYADGDPIGELPLRVRAVTGAVNVLVPAGGAACPAFADASPPPPRVPSRHRRIRRRPAGSRRGAGRPLMAAALAAKLAHRACCRHARAPARRRRDQRPGQGAAGTRRQTRSARSARGCDAAACSCRRRTARRRRRRWPPAILERAGVPLVHNAAGANMAGGIATALLAASAPARRDRRRAGAVRGRRAVARRRRGAASPACDPAGQPVSRPARPLRRARDDRRALGQRRRRPQQMVLNADDPMIADLGRERAERLYFGVEDDSLALPGHGARRRRQALPPLRRSVRVRRDLPRPSRPLPLRELRPAPARTRGERERRRAGGRAGGQLHPARAGGQGHGCSSRCRACTTSTTRSPPPRSRRR